jgi:hypothetical protein
MVQRKVMFRLYFVQSIMLLTLRNLAYLFNQNSTTIVSIRNEYLIVNMQVIQIRVSVHMVLCCTLVLHLYCLENKVGKSVTLSSTEAYYYATSDIAKEVNFGKNL